MAHAVFLFAGLKFPQVSVRGVAVGVALAGMGARPAFSQTAPPAPSPPAATPGNPLDAVNEIKPTMPPSTAMRRPDLFAPLPTYRSKNNFFFNGAADVRYRTESQDRHQGVSGETVGSYIAATRLTLDYIRANPLTGDERGGARLQLLMENDNVGTALNRVRPSEIYGFYRFLFPGVSANVRAGQFVLPFGLLAVYDTPLQPVQSLYEKSLGLRVDTGVMLEGDYGLYHYAGSLTTGSGPQRPRQSGGKVFAFRLSRTVETRQKLRGLDLGRFQVGGSLLSGSLPDTDFETRLPPSGFVEKPLSYVNKTRFAGDAEYFLGPVTARGEIVFGGDAQNPVYGHFIEGDYRFTPRFSVVGFSRRWDFAAKPQSSSTLGTGFNYRMGRNLVLRSLYEYDHNTSKNAGSPALIRRRISLQTRLNF